MTSPRTRTCTDSSDGSFTASSFDGLEGYEDGSTGRRCYTLRLLDASSGLSPPVTPTQPPSPDRTHRQPPGTPGRARRRRPHRTLAPWHPRVLGTWVAIGFGALCARLPLWLLLQLGSLLGRVVWLVGGRRRRITEINLSLCFPDPELTAVERRRLGRSTFRHLGISIAETLVAWLGPGRPLDHRVTLEGFDELRAAARSGRGVLLVGAHFACMEFIGGPLSRALALDVVYRRNRNPAWEWLQVRGRGRYFRNLIERDDARGIVRALRNGHVVWYAPDQDYGPRNAVFAPFFGVPAATLTATSRIATLTGAAVFFMAQHRDLGRRRWRVQVYPLPDFPTNAPDADARQLNLIIETAIRVDPAQYLWLHRRFKTPPPGASSPY